MKIEKICEYLNVIGLLQFDNINTFLNIYSQISKNKYKKDSEKIIIALFSYISFASKNDQNLYQICQNIIDSFSNNQILRRYKGIKYLNIIFRSKLHSRYNLFLIKIFHFINNKKNNKKIINSKNNKNLDIKPKNEEFKNNTQFNIYNNADNNNFTFKNNKIKKGIIVRKNKNDFGDIDDIIDKLSSDKEKEYAFSQDINNKYKTEIKQNKRNMQLNYNYDDYKYSPNLNYYKKENAEDKNIAFKSNINYGHNDKIDKEIEKLYDYYHNHYQDNPNNYPVKKKSKSKNKKNSPNFSKRKKSPNYIHNAYNYYQNDNYRYYPYYGNGDYYNFYEKEKDYERKVDDKILELKIQKFNEISQQCPFYPKVNNFINYPSNIQTKNQNGYKTLNKCITSMDINNKNALSINNLYYLNNLPNQKIIRMKQPNKKNSIDNDSNTSKMKKKINHRSYSATKLKTNESKFLINKEEEKDKKKINDNNNIGKKDQNNKKRASFEERQKKYIEEKQKKNKENKGKKKIENNKNNNKSKVDSKSVVDRLYDSKDIKNKLKEKEENSKKKKIIDWDKRIKEHNKQFPDDIIGVKKKPKKIQSNIGKNDKILDFDNFSKKKQGKENIIETKDEKNNGKKNENNNAIINEKKEDVKNENIKIINDENNFNNNKGNSNVFNDEKKDENNIGIKNAEDDKNTQNNIESNINKDDNIQNKDLNNNNANENKKSDEYNIKLEELIVNNNQEIEENNNKKDNNENDENKINNVNVNKKSDEYKNMLNDLIVSNNKENESKKNSLEASNIGEDKKEEENKAKQSINFYGDNNIKESSSSIFSSINYEEKLKQLENKGLLRGSGNNQDIKSGAVQNLISKKNN